MKKTETPEGNLWEELVPSTLSNVAPTDEILVTPVAAVCCSTTVLCVSLIALLYFLLLEFIILYNLYYPFDIK